MNLKTTTKSHSEALPYHTIANTSTVLPHMAKRCAISGFPIIKSPYFSGYLTRGVHPLMECTTEHLISLATSKAWIDWKDEEAKILFLAIANSIEMLDVVAPAFAKPSPRLIASCIENLILVAGWKGIRNFTIPTYRIVTNTEGVPSNEGMLAFPDILATIILDREKTIASMIVETQAKRLEETIKILFSKCSIGANKHRMLRNKVAQWALKITHEALNKERVGQEVRDLWFKMLTTPPIDAHKFNTVDIAELDDFMMDFLPHGCTASYEVMRHITSMREATIELASFLSAGDTIEVISDNFIPPPEPQETDFPNKTAFLIAKAKWRIAYSGLAANNSNKKEDTNENL